MAAAAPEKNIEEQYGNDLIEKLVGRVEQYPHPSFSPASIKHATADFRPRPTDVLISTAPKTGTTWLQCICHHLRSEPGCDWNYDDIYQVAPWMGFAKDLGIDLNQDQVASPRLFKLHQRISALPRGCKYLVTVRDPIRTVISWYRFLHSKGIPKITAYANVSEFVLKENNYWGEGGMRFGCSLWRYYNQIYKCRNLSNVCVMVFEDMAKDLRAQLPKLADFLEVEYTDEKLDMVASSSTKAAMQAHENAFNESWTYTQLQLVNTCLDIPSFKPTTRITDGHTDSLNEEALVYMQEQWDKEIAKTLGIASYAELVKEIRNPL